MTTITQGPTDQQDTGHAIFSDRAAQRHNALSSWYPLIAICAAQAALSLTLVWSNTAFADEASYLWVGRVMIAHWLHGAPTPTYLNHLSGSPAIYPPIGAVVSGIGGLAAARLLSLVFMLGGTALLFLSAARIVGRMAAVLAAALWAFSEPVIRLAFATFDPMSVFLTTLSAWLIVQSGFRRRRWWFIAAAAATLALANATAFSGIVIDPVMIGFAYLIWRDNTSGIRALRDTALFAAGVAAFIVLALTVSSSWNGTATIFARGSADRQGLTLVLADTWKFSGLVIALAMLGALVAVIVEDRHRAMLLAFLGLTVLTVPIAQIKFHTAWSLDKHPAYDIWFAAMAAGYGISRFVAWVPSMNSLRKAICCVLILAYPAVNSWESAWAVYHAWPNSSSFVAAFEPIAVRTGGLVYASDQIHIAQYYTPEIHNWARWNENGLPFSPPGQPSSWKLYYVHRLSKNDYGVVALFYVTSFSSITLPGKMLLGSHARSASRELLNLVAVNSRQPGLSALTLVLEHSREYKLMAVGPYDSATAHGVYAIWKKVSSS